MRFSPPPYFPLSRLSLSLENPIPRKLSNSGWVHCTNGRKYPWNYSKHMQPRNIVRYGGVFVPPIFPSESKVLWSPVDPASSYCWIIPPPPLSVRVTFCSSKNLPGRPKNLSRGCFICPPANSPLSSFYRAYTALISSPNDNTLHIYDRSRGNQKTAGNNFLFLSFGGFLSKVFSDFFQKFFLRLWQRSALFPTHRSQHNHNQTLHSPSHKTQNINPK